MRLVILRRRPFPDRNDPRRIGRGTADGTPDLSGLWLPDAGPRATKGIGETLRSPYFLDITADMNATCWRENLSMRGRSCGPSSTVA